MVLHCAAPLQPPPTTLPPDVPNPYPSMDPQLLPLPPPSHIAPSWPYHPLSCPAQCLRLPEAAQPYLPSRRVVIKGRWWDTAATYEGYGGSCGPLCPVAELSAGHQTVLLLRHKVVLLCSFSLNISCIQPHSDDGSLITRTVLWTLYTSFFIHFKDCPYIYRQLEILTAGLPNY